MKTPDHYTAAKIKRIELKSQIADLERLENFFEALIPAVLIPAGFLMLLLIWI